VVLRLSAGLQFGVPILSPASPSYLSYFLLMASQLPGLNVFHILSPLGFLDLSIPFHLVPVWEVLAPSNF